MGKDLRKKTKDTGGTRVTHDSNIVMRRRRVRKTVKGKARRGLTVGRKHHKKGRIVSAA